MAHFSSGWVAIIMYLILVTVSSKKDLTIFMRMGSLGAVCVCCMIIFVVTYGVMALKNTDFKV